MVRNNGLVPLSQLKSILQDKSVSSGPSVPTAKETQLSNDAPRNVDDLLAEFLVKTTPRTQQTQAGSTAISNRAIEDELFKNNETTTSSPNNNKEKDFVELLNGWSLQQNNIKRQEDQSRREDRVRVKAAFQRLLEKEEFLDMLVDELKNV
eukprot:TRINITY_DN6570_c0_g1_i8.p3 TRINITY_DN6570_c0_g1~~TRINITY_DN6570_c0_g1_i8.p3  ORF type:complete len:151 (-),score=33.01 TRINITY_DN6570_c0_g1_i8:260-712(-)